MAVAVEVMEPQKIYMNRRFPASIVGKDYVNVRPKVSGYVEKWVAKEGATVKKGDVIIQISEDTYLQSLRVAEEAVNVAQASVGKYQLSFEKTQSLYDNKI